MILVTSREMGEMISSSCIFIVKIAISHFKQTNDKTTVNLIFNIYQELLNSFVSKNLSLPGSLFHRLFSLEWGDLWQFTDLLITNAFSKEIRPYYRNQCLHLLHELYNNKAIFNSVKEKKRIKKEEALSQALIQVNI